MYTHSPSLPLVEKGSGSWVVPLFRDDSTSCNPRVGPLVGPPTQFLPRAQLMAGRGLTGLVSVHSFCGGVTSGDKVGWVGWEVKAPQFIEERSLVTPTSWGSGKGRSKPSSHPHASHSDEWPQVSRHQALPKPWPRDTFSAPSMLLAANLGTEGERGELPQ